MADEDVLGDREIGEEPRLLVNYRDAKGTSVSGSVNVDSCPSRRIEPLSG